jgi:hypothetical protein
MGGFLGGTHSVRPRGKAGRKPGRLMITDGRAKGWWPKRDNISVGVMSTLRACGARPSAGALPGLKALRGKARNNVGGWFSRRDALCASANTGGMQARVWHDHRGVSAGRALSGDTPRLRPSRFYGRAEPAPPRGGRSEARWPCGGRPGDDAKGDFLGGTRSARPPGKAVRMPRHLVPPRCVAERGGPSGDMPR